MKTRFEKKKVESKLLDLLGKFRTKKLNLNTITKEAEIARQLIYESKKSSDSSE